MPELFRYRLIEANTVAKGIDDLRVFNLPRHEFKAGPVTFRKTLQLGNMALISRGLAACLAKSKVPCSRISLAAPRNAPKATRQRALPTLMRFTPRAES